MLTKGLRRTAKRVLIVCAAATLMAALGLGDFTFLEGREKAAEPGRTLFAAETVYAADGMEGDYASQVIPDENLAQVMRIVVN